MAGTNKSSSEEAPYPFDKTKNLNLETTFNPLTRGRGPYGRSKVCRLIN